MQTSDSDMKHLTGPTLSIALLRVAMGMVFMSHALLRISEGSVLDFGDFLISKGFPAGSALAWAVTVFELLGGLCMLARRFVQWFCAGEIIILLTGILLVHAPNGWFVVGHSLNGPEYSVVLIIILITVFIAERMDKNRG